MLCFVAGPRPVDVVNVTALSDTSASVAWKPTDVNVLLVKENDSKNQIYKELKQYNILLSFSELCDLKNAHLLRTLRLTFILQKHGAEVQQERRNAARYQKVLIFLRRCVTLALLMRRFFRLCSHSAQE